MMGSSPTWRVGYVVALIGVAADHGRTSRVEDGKNQGSTLADGFAGLAVAAVGLWVRGHYPEPAQPSLAL